MLIFKNLHMAIELATERYRAAYALGFVLIITSVALDRYELPLIGVAVAICVYSLFHW